MATRTLTPATRLPGPPELLPGRPDAIVDLQTDAGLALVAGEWRHRDARVEEIDFVAVGHPEDPLGPGIEPNRTYDVLPHAEAADFDDSALGRPRARGHDAAALDRPGVLHLVPAARDAARARRGSRCPRDHGGLRGGRRRLRRGVGERRAAGAARRQRRPGRRRVQRTEPRHPHTGRAPGGGVRHRRLRHQRPDLGLAAQLHLAADRDAGPVRAGAGRRGGAGGIAHRAHVVRARRGRAT